MQLLFFFAASPAKSEKRNRAEKAETPATQIESEIRVSLKMAWARDEMVTSFIQEKAQIDEKNVIESHIKMFVNDFSEVIGRKGEAALERLWMLSDC